MKQEMQHILTIMLRKITHASIHNLKKVPNNDFQQD